MMKLLILVSMIFYSTIFASGIMDGNRPISEITDGTIILIKTDKFTKFSILAKSKGRKIIIPKKTTFKLVNVFHAVNNSNVITAELESLYPEFNNLSPRIYIFPSQHIETIDDLRRDLKFELEFYN